VLCIARKQSHCVYVRVRMSVCMHPRIHVWYGRKSCRHVLYFFVADLMTVLAE